MTEEERKGSETSPFLFFIFYAGLAVLALSPHNAAPQPHAVSVGS